jgi:hypothetical protein
MPEPKPHSGGDTGPVPGHALSPLSPASIEHASKVSAAVSARHEANGTAIERPRGTPKGPSRRFSRTFAASIREGVSPDLLRDYLLAIMAGHGDARFTEDFKAITWGPVGTGPGRGGVASTPAQIEWAWTQLRQGGWGMPVQAIALEADIRQHTTTTTELPLADVPPADVRAIRNAVRGALARAREQAEGMAGAAPRRELAPARARDIDPASVIDVPDGMDRPA